MHGMKNIVVVSMIVAVAAVLGACRREVPAEPLKLGGDVASVTTVR